MCCCGRPGKSFPRPPEGGSHPDPQHAFHRTHCGGRWRGIRSCDASPQHGALYYDCCILIIRDPVAAFSSPGHCMKFTITRDSLQEGLVAVAAAVPRSEEHTSELQS